MVLTRSQARAAAQDQAGILEGIFTEVHDEELLAVVPAHAPAQNVRLESQVSRIVDSFWSETQRLAAETTMMQSNQVQQAKEYHAALAAIHHDARSSTAELAAHQQWIEGQIRKALEDTNLALQQELQVISNAQVVGNESSRLFTQEQLQSARGVAHLEVLEMKSAIAAQAAKVEQIEREMTVAITNAHSALAQRIDGVLLQPQAAINGDVKGQMEEMWDAMQKQIDMKFQQMTSSIVEKCIAKLEESGGVTTGRLTIRRVQRLVSEYVANQEEKMEHKIKHLVQSAHSQISNEMINSFEKLGSNMRENIRQQLKDESAATEVHMENRVRDMLQKAHEERVIESRRQMEATRAVEGELERTRTELNTEVRELKARLDKLENKTNEKSPIIRVPPKRRTERGNNTRSQDERVGRMEQYVQAELRRVLQLTLSLSITIPPVSSDPVHLRSQQEQVPVPHHSTKVKRAIDQAQKAVKRRLELAARRYDALHKNETNGS
ncbi:hypothetical protein GN244_ATG17982 [Phytophthora infestans]|uniref:Uncharacterized protein n=1 Tax=Phytophthora infestans TaxID=4787 RepID=A0A833W680_PHYIN|nr:hypothetical protein GN244_ATG17982 [Phytophthora infestans]